MLRGIRELEGYRVSATDGDVGSVRDFYFDDERWAIRYLVADTGVFFAGRRVLVSPIAFRQADWATKQFHLSRTREKVKSSPGIDLDKPISRQHEKAYSRHYGWPYYWGVAGAGVWAGEVFPGMLASRAWADQHPEGQDDDDPHLRSVREVAGYHIQGKDGDIGHIDDFIVDDETWAIRYLVVDTRNWWLDRKVLVSPRWAERIDWAENNVYLDLTRQAIKDSPEWHSNAPVNRAYELMLHDHYGRPAYWSDEASR